MNQNTFFISKCLLVVSVLSILGFGCTGGSRSFGPPKENVFRMVVESKITSLDPHVTSDVYSLLGQSLAYESLYEYHHLKGTTTLVPLLAQSLPKISKDFKTYTFTLKKGVHFQDDPCFTSTNGKGPELTSADLVYYFERIAAPKFVSPVFGSFEGRIVGIDDFHAGKATSISGVKAIDRYTVEVKLTRPMPRFVYNFIDAHGALMNKECVANLGERISMHPVGTGPYKVTEANLSSKIVAVKNPNYKHMTYPADGKPGDSEAGLLADAGKQLPFVDKAVLEVIVERQPAWLKFKAGELEMANIPKDFIPRELPGGKLSEELAKRGVQHRSEPRGDVTVTIFNMEDPVWGKKKELRQAYQLALDVAQIIKIQYESQAIRAHSLINPTMYAYDPGFVSKWADRNLEKARQLLAKAGYPNGEGLPPLVMPTNEGPTSRQLDELMTRQLGEVGIKVKSEPMTWPEFDKRIRTKRFTVVGMGFSSNAPDPEDFTAMLESKNAAPGHNYANYRNPEADKLIEEIENMPNGSARMAKINRLRDIIDEDLPYAPMVHRIGHQFSQSWLKNVVYFDYMHTATHIKYMKVQTATEAK